MTEKKSFVLYHSFAAAFELLSMEERGQLITEIFAHETGMEAPTELSDTVRMAFAFIKDTLERDRETYEEKCRKNAENGKKGGRPRSLFVKKNSSSEDSEKPSTTPVSADKSEERTVGENEREELIRRGIPDSYFGQRLARASDYAAKSAKSIVDVLTEWWKKDSVNSTQSREIRQPKPMSNLCHSNEYFEDWFEQRCLAVF